jgi:hypothetical protein
MKSQKNNGRAGDPVPQEDDFLLAMPNNIDAHSAIDGGAGGALTTVFKDGTWVAYPVQLTRERGHRKLDVHGNLSLLNSVARRAGGRDRVFVVYERSRQNPLFGIKNSFVNGQNEEFWRVVLTLGGFRFGSVDPKTWQAYCFKGIAGPGPKDRALKFVRQNCVDLGWLEAYTKALRCGIADAACIALWSRALAERGRITALAQPIPRP